MSVRCCCVLFFFCCLSRGASPMPTRHLAVGDGQDGAGVADNGHFVPASAASREAKDTVAPFAASKETVVKTTRLNINNETEFTPTYKFTPPHKITPIQKNLPPTQKFTSAQNLTQTQNLTQRVGAQHSILSLLGDRKRRSKKRVTYSTNSTNAAKLATSAAGRTTSNTDVLNASRTVKPEKWYDTAGWLPHKAFKPDRTVNLTVLPMVAFVIFVFAVCIRCYSWMREKDRTKDRGVLDFEDADELNYTIITAGEQGYREIDLRSDGTSMYDTVTSFRSLRIPGYSEQLTITSVRSLPNQPYEALRSIIMQKADEGVYDSVHSYRAFLERTIRMSDDVDIEVEQIEDYDPRPRSKSYSGSDANATRSRKRRARRHSGGKSVEGGAKALAEKERFRRHSGNSVPHPSSDPLRGMRYRRSSPAILEPLVQEGESRSHTGPSDDEDVMVPLPKPGAGQPRFTLDRQSSNSSSSTGGSSGGSGRGRKVKDPTSATQTHRQRREKLRQKRASQDKLADKQTGKGVHQHRHRRCSDDSPRSSSPSDGGSSNEVDSESDVTDSGLVVDLSHADLSPSPKLLEFPKHDFPKDDVFAKDDVFLKDEVFHELPKPVELPEKSVVMPKRVRQSCFKNKSDGNGNGSQRSGSEADGNGDKAVTTRKVARFKVSFVDDATLSPTSD